jgi:hypothetical protein
VPILLKRLLQNSDCSNLLLGQIWGAFYISFKIKDFVENSKSSKETKEMKVSFSSDLLANLGFEADTNIHWMSHQCRSVYSKTGSVYLFSFNFFNTSEVLSIIHDHRHCFGATHFVL